MKRNCFTQKLKANIYVCTCRSPKRETPSVGDKRSPSEKKRKWADMLRQKLHTKSNCNVSRVSSKGQGGARLGKEAGCLPVIFPLASKGGCQLTMTARGFPSRVMTVKSLGAEVGAVRWDRDKVLSLVVGRKKRHRWAFCHDTRNQDLSLGLSCLFCLLQFIASIWRTEVKASNW